MKSILEKMLKLQILMILLNLVVGLLEENELIVDIDCLSKKKIEKLISLFNIQTQTVWTTRGAHFYFKKPQSFRGSKAVCPLGFEVEYKHTKIRMP